MAVHLVRVEQVGGTVFAIYDNGQKIMLIPSTAGVLVPERKVLDPATAPPPPDGDPDVNPPAGVPTGDGITITREMVLAAVHALGGTESAMLQSAENVAGGFNDALDNTFGRGILSHRNRAANLIGQCAQETGGFRLIKEQGVDNARYAPYIGRGWIQVTWRDNYLSFGRFLKKWGVITDENLFVNNPSQLEDLKYAPYTAVWEFTYKSWSPHGNLFEWCDVASDPWETIGRAINTGSPKTTFSNWYGKELRRKAVNAVLAVTPQPATRASIVSPVKSGTYTLSAYFGQTGSWANYHTGQDFAADTGTPVYAVADGTILGGMGFGAAGNSLVLAFGDSEEAAYWHLDTVDVSAGTVVKAGQKIGTVGNTGNSFGPHLHFEYYPKSASYRDIYTATNPRTWLKSKGIEI